MLDNKITRTTAAASVLALLAACASAPKENPAAPPASSPKFSKAPEAAAPLTPPPAPRPSRALFACKMKVSNAPPFGPDRRIVSAPAHVALKGVALRLAPVTEGCLSSGFGPRGTKLHRGVDYFARGGDVLAAGGGAIKEALTRADFGNMIVIDHGGGVYTRYAHLASFARPFAVGDKVKDGGLLGPIGATGAAGAPHLHFEILSGAYVSGVGSFGLTHHDPFALPAAN